jgi:sugar lactone lactonase YvrE
MKSKWLVGAAILLSFSLFPASSTHAQIPNNPTFTRLFTSITSGIEGLTGRDGFLYVTDRGVANANCSVWKIDPNAAPDTAAQVGQITGPCRPSGLTFDKHGDLFITTVVGAAAATNVIYKLTPNQANPTGPDATGVAVVTGVFGANGVAFDKRGWLYVSDGTTNQGRVWRIKHFPADCTTDNLDCKELFRIQPMRNDDALGGQVADMVATTGVGRQNSSFPGGAQDLVANGLAFNALGSLFVADTARGAIWKADFDFAGNLKSEKGCDETFNDNVLCMENLWLSHPRLEGLDGIALDLLGNIWGTANERNAIVVAIPLLKKVVEFQNPADVGGTYLRNNGPLEFPTSPFLSGKKLCITHADSGRRDNAPNTGGEIAGTGAGKVSCMNQNLFIPGLPLPVK